MKLWIKRIRCDNCGTRNPVRGVNENGSKGYTTCCGWGKPFTQWLHLRWPFEWRL